MRYELVRYEGVGATMKTTVVDSGSDADELYAKRDALDANPTVSLETRRHGVRPV